MKRLRKTRRKELIERILEQEFPNQLVLLEELRWRVLIEEHKEKSQALWSMDESHMESFARTIRNHMAGLKIHKIHLNPRRIQAGIVARAAVFRIRERTTLEQFLTEENAWMCLNCANQQESGRVTLGCFLVTSNPGSD